ncbi:Bug family tripartite tricarboxylate transporter substrate binding protein [Pseudoduganella namucuonensis]|uniref:Tripartite-type tricarboxylate transporter, receptor component TctC n=1 Tax=Pseudoduganella namucuonensis TaxID=1035707 RepID=A0A1I7LNK6_9BURK|nr:tripartite tricarboxylate transporter substrate binding protein [Pseudoduganella namucuonensis]SFV11225.1 Tripartite-type tricarboxylate transporter, receptor component TctC [Pseudoduganella namucuonensis]
MKPHQSLKSKVWTGALLALYALHGVATTAAAQPPENGFPTQTITLIASAAPGGTTDLAARMIAEPLSKALGKPVIVENRPGASGAIAANVVKRANPDGYTLLVQYSGYHVITPHLVKTGFDPIKDFAPVANLIMAPQVIVVRPDLPVQTFSELFAYAKANPGKLTYASSGNGSLQHVTGEMIKQLGAINMTHVPYKGTGPAITDLLGGNVDMTFTTAPPLLGHIKSGKMRVLAVTGKVRLPILPDVRATSEIAGFDKLDASSWFAIYAPAATPKPVIDKLSAEIARIMKTEEFKRKAAEQGALAAYMNPQQLGEFTRNELYNWGRFVKTAHITAD